MSRVKAVESETAGSETVGSPHERGQVAPLIAIVIVVVLVVVAGLARLGAVAASGAAAQAAADATALAAALDGRAAGEEVAVANGARLVGFRQAGELVQVEVERAGRAAVATAERYLTDESGGSP